METNGSIAKTTRHEQHRDAEHIPPELKAIPNWISYQLIPQPDGKKTRKVPFTPGANATKARVNDPTTWRTYAEAVADHERTGRLPGFVITPEMNLTLVDVDRRIDHGLIEALDSYTELSVSGAGIHILVHGRPPAGFVAPPGVEIYPREGNRGVVLTGDLIDGRGTIEDRTAELAALCPPKPQPVAPVAPELTIDDDAALTNARRMPGFVALFDHGHLSAYGGDHSRADVGLLNYLITAGVTDPAQLDRLHRASALSRNKWDAKSGATTYGVRTISFALNGHVVPYDGWPTLPARHADAPKSGAIAGDPQDAALVAGAEAPSSCTNQVAALEHRIVELEAQLAGARADNTALVQMVQNPNLTLIQIRAGLAVATESKAKRDRGEVDDTGCVQVSTGEVSRDYRPKPADGERLAPTNPDGSRPRLARANVKPVITEAIERGLIPATPRRVPRSHSGGAKYIDTEWDVSPPASLADALSPWANWHPEEPVARKPRTVPAACPECGEVHPIKRQDVCTGCGSIIKPVTIQPPAETGDNLSPPEMTAAPHVATTRIGRSFISGLPEEPAWLADAPDLSWDDSIGVPPTPQMFPGFEPPPLDHLTDIAYGARK